MQIRQTELYRRLDRANAEVTAIVDKLAAAKSRVEFEMLCSVFGYVQEMPTHIFLFVFARKLADICPSDVIADDETAALNGFLDLVYDLARNTTLINKALQTTAFVNLCGRWMSKGFRRKDKSMFLKLAKLLAITAEKAGF